MGFTVGLLLGGFAAASETPRSFAELFSPDLDFPYFAEVSDWPSVRDEAPTAWSVHRAAMLAQLSLLVYVPDEDFVKRTAARAGFSEATFFEQSGSQAWLFQSADDQIVVFRGTEPQASEDLLTDLRFLPMRVDEHVAAHHGFVEAVSVLAPQIDAALDETDERSLWFTGHSLGGSLAQLYAWRQRAQVDAVYTFGAPRVLTARSVAALEVAVPCFRVVNNNDLVPHVPTPPVYAHAGTEWFIDAIGTLHRSPALHARVGDAWQGHRDYVERWLAHWRETRELKWTPGDGLADHAPAAYARALIRRVPRTADYNSPRS